MCANPQCRVMETHLRRAYAVEAQVTRLANTAGSLTAYLDGVLTGSPLPEPVATDLGLLSSMLLQISGLQGHALGRSLASLVVARRQLWLSQARVPDADKAVLLDGAYIWSGCRGDVTALQGAVLLPPYALAQGRSSRWQAPLARTITRMVPVPMAPLGDLRHHLQATAAIGNQALPQSTWNAGRPTNSITGGNFRAITLGSHLEVHHPNLSSPSRGSEGFRPQTHPFTA
ncbi:UNVERIFIED_CONTAM: hypothetical protein FKN15_014861 [Acipenser sinensis]